MPPVAHPTAEDRQWRRRRRKGGSRTGGPLHGLRIRDLERVLRNRWGPVLPPDDAGRDDAALVLHHIAGHPLDPRRRMEWWLSTWCPWMTPADADALVTGIIAKPLRFRADTLAKKLNLTAADRDRWQITTIGAVDLAKEARAAARRERNRQTKMAHRRARGVESRAKYIASTKARGQKPWQVEGVSRATWYRRQHRGTDETVRGQHIVSTMLYPHRLTPFDERSSQAEPHHQEEGGRTGPVKSFAPFNIPSLPLRGDTPSQSRQQQNAR